MSTELLNFRIHNPAGDATLMFLHGMLGDLGNWNSQAKLLSSQYRVINADLRNHGASPHMQGMSYREMAEDVKRLLEHLRIQKINLCGHSMGGKVAMTLALKRPDLIEKLIIVDISPVNYPLRHQQVFQALLALPLDQLAKRKQADEWLSEKLADPFERAFLLKNLQADSRGGFRWRSNLAEIVRNYLRIKDFPATHARFEKPALFIAGSQSDYILEDYQPAIKKLFPQAVIQYIENAGHLPHIQQAGEFSKVLRTFLHSA